MAEGPRMKSSCRNFKTGGNESIEVSFPPVLFFNSVPFLPVSFSILSCFCLFLFQSCPASACSFFDPGLFLPVPFLILSCFCLYH